MVEEGLHPSLPAFVVQSTLKVLVMQPLECIVVLYVRLLALLPLHCFDGNRAALGLGQESLQHFLVENASMPVSLEENNPRSEPFKAGKRCIH